MPILSRLCIGVGYNEYIVRWSCYMIQITTIGIVLISIVLLFQFLPIKYTIYLLFLSCIFPSVMCASIQNTGINICIIIELILIVRVLLIYKRGKIVLNRGLLYLLLFGIWSSFVTIIAPIVFSKLTYDFKYNSLLAKQVSFVLDINAISKILLLLMHIFAAIAIYQVNNEIEYNELFKFFSFECVVVIVFGFWQYASVMGVNLMYPSDIIYGNIGYGVWNAKRMKSTFNEASYLSGFLAPYIVGSFAFKEKKYYILTIFCSICLILSASSTGIVSVACGMLILLFIKRRSANYLGKFLVVGILSGLIISGSDVYQNVISVISEKFNAYFGLNNNVISSTGAYSGSVRTLWDQVSLDVFFKTWGFGGGLASTRGNSFVITVLATTGIIGFLLFFLFSYYYIADAYKKIPYNIMALFVFLVSIVNIISKAVALPDINDLSMWMILFLMIIFKEDSGKVVGHDENSKKYYYS